MHVELLQPMEFGTGPKKVGDVVDIAHTLAEDFIRQGRATWPKGTKERTAAEKKQEPGDSRSTHSRPRVKSRGSQESEAEKS